MYGLSIESVRILYKHHSIKSYSDKKMSQEIYTIFFLFLTLLLSKLLKMFPKTCTDYFRIVRSDVMALKINCINSKFIISNLRKGPNFDMDSVKN